MSTLSFVERVELEFSGNHFSHALCLEDVDNDGLNELAIGNVVGTLAVFKSVESSKPWKSCTDLGNLTCVGAGDLFNISKNVLIAISAEGDCYIFDFTDVSKEVGTILPLCVKQITPNVKAMEIADLGCCGQHDLFVGLTDRNVKSYRWKQATGDPVTDGPLEGSLVLQQSFHFVGQVGSLSVGYTSGGDKRLLISQPGGTYIPVCADGSSSNSDRLIQLMTVGNPMRSQPEAPTEVVAGISDGSDSPASTVATASLDTVRFLKDDQKQWELCLEHSFFTIGKLKILANGSDSIVVCSWDGLTYVIDHNKSFVRFQFEENVCAFHAGQYGIGTNRSCLVYTTFSNRILVYYNIQLKSMSPSNLLIAMSKEDVPHDIKERLSKLDAVEKRKLLSQCLYGPSS
ncbi:KICSTOR complex protein ITFG2-like [Dysidea avara]|uniref:KICSTOR complex protein ITFG2-like n=1 Tax=Dysidea avara TaxID=196820 RepID=UPI0033207502